jgi:hypothetical protein
MHASRGWIIGGAAAVVGIAGAAGAVAITRARAVTITIPAGASVVAALDHTVSTNGSEPGDPVRLTTEGPGTKSRTAIPAGLSLEGEVTHAKGGGRIAGAPELTIRVTAIRSNGERYPVEAAPLRFRGKSDGAESAAEIGGGVVAGAVLGKIVGNDALAGAVLGGAAGTAVAVATKGDQIVLRAGSRLRFRLSEPLTLKVRPGDVRARDGSDES